MKRLFLLIGLVVFLTPMLVSGEKVKELLDGYEGVYCADKENSIIYSNLNCLSSSQEISIKEFKKYSNCRKLIGNLKKRRYDKSTKKTVTLSSKCRYGEQYDQFKLTSCFQYTTCKFCLKNRPSDLHLSLCTRKFGHTSIHLANIKGPSNAYESLAVAVGCGIKRKDVDDCIKRWLPSIIGSSPLDDTQLDEIKKDKNLMKEITFGIEQMKRAQDESHQPTEEEQRQAQQQNKQSPSQTKGKSSDDDWPTFKTGFEKWYSKWGFKYIQTW